MWQKVGIYKITSPSGKVYIGQSWDIGNRHSCYKTKPDKNQPKIYNSLKKYSFENHKFEIIHELPKDITQEILDNYEILYWDLYKNCGIDMMNVKEPGSGGKHSQETKDKISKINKGRIRTDKTWLGRKHSPESIEKMRLSSINRTKKPKRIKIKIYKESYKDKKIRIRQERINNGTFGKRPKMSEESKIKMSMSKKGKLKTTMINNKIIEIYNKDNKLIDTCFTATQASNITGVNRSAISNNLIGISKSTRMFKFNYKEVPIV